MIHMIIHHTYIKETIVTNDFIYKIDRDMRKKILSVIFKDI